MDCMLKYIYLYVKYMKENEEAKTTFDWKTRCKCFIKSYTFIFFFKTI